MIFKGNKGITLISLIVTIIVLLILAGVTISQITGSENAMEKATEAREKNEQGAELEAIKLAVVNSVASDLTGLVNADNLKEGLNGLVEEIKGVAFSTKTVNVKQGKNVEIEIINVTGEELELTPSTSNGITIVKGENNKITISASSDAEIGATVSFTATAGTDSDTCNVEVVKDKATEINRLIGNNVYYSVSISGQTNPIDKWQIFYADDENEEVFIISEYILETNKKIGGTNTTSNDFNYINGASSSSLATNTYGRNYNKKWFEVEGMPNIAKQENGTIYNNAKTVAYLCDSTNPNWTKYINNGEFGMENNKVAVPNKTYAVGGPTIELLQNSIKKYNSTNITLTVTRNRLFKFW